MRKNKLKYIYLVVLLFNLVSCQHRRLETTESKKTRPLKDTIGFAQYSWQMDSLMTRMDCYGWEKTDGMPWKLAICPHDDYTYVGTLYPELLNNAAFYLNGSRPVNGELIGYSTSITSAHIPVDDISMGRTAIATDCHWVGYAALGYR